MSNLTEHDNLRLILAELILESDKAKTLGEAADAIERSIERIVKHFNK